MAGGRRFAADGQRPTGRFGARTTSSGTRPVSWVTMTEPAGSTSTSAWWTSARFVGQPDGRVPATGRARDVRRPTVSTSDTTARSRRRIRGRRRRRAVRLPCRPRTGRARVRRTDLDTFEQFPHAGQSAPGGDGVAVDRSSPSRHDGRAPVRGRRRCRSRSPDRTRRRRPEWSTMSRAGIGERCTTRTWAHFARPGERSASADASPAGKGPRAGAVRNGRYAAGRSHADAAGRCGRGGR